MHLNQRMFKTTLLAIFLLFVSGCLPMSYKDLKKGDLVIETNRKPGSISDSEEIVSAEIRLGDRFYIESVFKSVFGPSYDSSSIVTTNIVNQQSVFGGPCDFYERSLLPNSRTLEKPRSNCFDSNWNTEMVIGSTSLREGWRVRSCELVVKNNPTAVQYVFNRASIDSNNDSLSYEKVNLLYKMFYPVEDLPEAVFQEIYAYDESIERTELWKSVLIAFCVSPEWQVP